MNLDAAVTIVACAGHLALASITFLAGARSPLAVPLGLLCFDQFTWNAAALAYAHSGYLGWHWVDMGVSPFALPLALHVIVAFVGRTRRLRPWLTGSYASAGLLSAFATAALFSPQAARWTASDGWSLSFLLLDVLLLGAGAVLLMQHLRVTTGFAERARTRVMLAACCIGAVLSWTELLHNMNAAVPALGNLGGLLSTTLVAAVSLRFELFGTPVSWSAGLFSFALSAVGMLGYTAVFRFTRTDAALLILASATVTLALFFAARQVLWSFATYRANRERLTMLGRFSGQMAHDLRNPLGAVKGTLMFLRNEQDRGRALSEFREFIELMMAQVRRIERVLEDYDSLGHVDPIRTPLRLNDVVEAAIKLEQTCVPEAIAVRMELARDLPDCVGDYDLLTRVIENLLRNALDAMPAGGTLTVRTARGGGLSGNRRVELAVEDSGEGMDARRIDQAFDEFFTTKAKGSGLGLPFVRRVVHAHGGEVAIVSEPGCGTTVRVLLPAS